MFNISYGKCEAAFARTYDIADADLGRFRGRITGLQKGDLFGAENRPGKGNRLDYTPDMMHRVLFCLELTELGVTPNVQLKLVAEFWEPRIRKIFKRAEDAAERDPGEGDIILAMIGVSLMGGAWRDDDAVPNINWCRLADLYRRLVLDMQPRRRGDLAPRALIVNLSARLRVFHGHLSDVHLGPEPAEPAETEVE